MRLRDVNTEPVEATFRLVGRVVHFVMNLVVHKKWLGQDKIPQHGPVIFVCNHIGNFDVPALGEYLIYSGRWPRFLGKIDVFKIPILGRLGYACGQIPVERNTERAKNALVHAESALQDGKAVVIYPEGTITGDPDVWPMSAHHGAAKLALATRVPVVPVGQFGAHLVLGQKRLTWPKLWPKKTVTILAGDPIDLSEFYDLEPTKDVYERVSVRIIDVITNLVEIIRDEPAPEHRYDIRLGTRVEQSR